MAIEEDLSQWEIASTGKMVGYGFGYVIINYFLGYGLANLFYFYEVEIGLPVIYLAVAFVIFALWNMVNDPLLGYLTDRPRGWTKKYGLRAPWVVITSIPILLFFYFIWIPPHGWDAFMIFLWFILITCLFDTFFSIYNDHVYGGFTNQFPSEYERRRAFAITTILLFIILPALAVVSALIIEYGKPETFAIRAIIMIIVLAIFNVVLFSGIGESDDMKQMFLTSFENAEDIGFFKTMKTALKTKNFAVSLSGYTISITATSLYAASIIFLFRYAYQIDYSLIILPTIAGAIAGLCTIPFWTNYSRKHGFKKTYYTAYIIHGFLFLPFLFTTDIFTHTIAACLYNMVYFGEVTMLMPVASDTYDEVSSRMEKRVDATLVGVRTFFFRIAILVQGVVITLVHVMTGFNPLVDVQTAEAIWGIRIHTALVPGIMMIVMGLIFKKFYTLEGKEKEALVKKLKDLGIYR